MGHDIDIILASNGYCIGNTYITGNFSKYKDKYPGIHAIHGHKNSTVIKIICRTLALMLNDKIVPEVHNPGGRALTFGDADVQKDLECYAACLQEFLDAAIKIKNEYDSENIYWYSDQVWEITKFEEDGYESDGMHRQEEEEEEEEST